MTDYASWGALLVSGIAVVIAIRSWRQKKTDHQDDPELRIAKLETRVKELEETLALRNGALDSLSKRIGTLEDVVEKQRMQISEKDGTIGMLREDLAGARARLIAAGITR